MRQAPRVPKRRGEESRQKSAATSTPLAPRSTAMPRAPPRRGRGRPRGRGRGLRGRDGEAGAQPLLAALVAAGALVQVRGRPRARQGGEGFRRVDRGGAPRGEGTPEFTASGGASGDVRVRGPGFPPQISAPARPPRPPCSPSGTHSLGGGGGTRLEPGSRSGGAPGPPQPGPTPPHPPAGPPEASPPPGAPPPRAARPDRPAGRSKTPPTPRTPPAG